MLLYSTLEIRRTGEPPTVTGLGEQLSSKRASPEGAGWAGPPPPLPPLPEAAAEPPEPDTPPEPERPPEPALAPVP